MILLQFQFQRLAATRVSSEMVSAENIKFNFSVCISSHALFRLIAKCQILNFVIKCFQILLVESQGRSCKLGLT